MVKRECFEKIGLFDESVAFGTDYDMWIRLSKKFYFDYVEKCLVLYCKHEKSLSADIKMRAVGMEEILKRYDQFFAVNRKPYSQNKLRIGILYCKSGNMKKGRDMLLEAVKLYPFQMRAYINLGFSLLGERRFLELNKLERVCKVLKSVSVLWFELKRYLLKL